VNCAPSLSSKPAGLGASHSQIFRIGSQGFEDRGVRRGVDLPALAAMLEQVGISSSTKRRRSDSNRCIKVLQFYQATPSGSSLV
jgi:hypothetical protein